jgi:hypothetical protein
MLQCEKCLSVVYDVIISLFWLQMISKLCVEQIVLYDARMYTSCPILVLVLLDLSILYILYAFITFIYTRNA